MPKFCIVIPTYNSAKTINEAISSCLNQTFNDFSIVVSDNCSKDNTEEIVSPIDSKKLHYIRNNSFLNKSESWNRAYEQSEDCEYLVNLHSDDVLDKHCLKNISESLAKKPIFIHGPCKRMSFDGNIYKKKINYPFGYTMAGAKLAESVILLNHIGIVGTAINKNSFHKTSGWDVALEFFQDVSLWIELSKFGNSQYIPKLFGYYRQPKLLNPNKYIIEMIKWYEDIINFDENYDIRVAAVNSLERTLERIINSQNTLVDPLILDSVSSIYKKLKNMKYARYNVKLRLNFLKFTSMFI